MATTINVGCAWFKVEPVGKDVRIIQRQHHPDGFIWQNLGVIRREDLVANLRRAANRVGGHKEGEWPACFKLF